MDVDGQSIKVSALTHAHLCDLLAEGERARKLSSNVDGVKDLVAGIRLVNDTILAQVLFALWDSGFYEFSLGHPTFEVREAAEALQADGRVLGCLCDYLVGRGILKSNDGQMGLTEHGIRFSNILLYGTMNLYIGGWGRLLNNIGPLLRKEIAQAEFNNLRSARHTVKGTEQLGCIRVAPAVSQVLAQKKLKRVLHLACRNGEFLVELARLDPEIHGIGLDKSSERIALAKANAVRYGVESRLHFLTKEIGSDPLPLDDGNSRKIEVIVATYLLHEVGRHGRAKIVELLSQIRCAYPGRLFLFTETLPADSTPAPRKPATTFSQIDYLLIHRIRGQGLPLPPAQWESIIQDAGLTNFEMRDAFGNALYMATL